MRYAIYLTPPQASPLETTAARWLGRSAFSGVALTPQAPAAARAHVPGRYGFHATMKAPFRLDDGRTEAELLAAFRAYDAPAFMEALTVSRLASFVALTAVDETALARAAADAVEAFEPFRAPLTEAELARRRPDALDGPSRALLERWGYPYVMENFTFHMTLSGPVDEQDADAVVGAAERVFGPVISQPQALVFAIYREAEAGGPFTILATHSQVDA